MRMLLAGYIVLGLGWFTSSLAQQALMVVDSLRDRVILVSRVDGSVLNTSFIVHNNLQTSINAIQAPNGNILLSDQVNNAIYEYTLSGNLVGTVVGAAQGLQNIRGIAIHNNQLYVTVGGGTHQNTVQRFNLDATGQQTFITNTNLVSPFDVFFRSNGEVLVSNGTASTANPNFSRIQRFDIDGNFLGTFQNPAPGDIRFPQQIFERSNGNILVGGFSLPTAIYEYDANGNQLATLAPGLGTRGVYELENGLYLFTAGTRLATVDPATGTVVDIINDLGSSFRYIEPVNLAVPEPATIALTSFLIAGALGYSWYRRRETQKLLQRNC